MEHNTHREFVGLETIKEKQKWQLDLFKSWADKNQCLNLIPSLSQ
jgi:hypothetical protein